MPFKLTLKQCAYNCCIVNEDGWLVHCEVYNLNLKCLFTGMCCDAAEILAEAGVVCDSLGWQLKCVLLYKPVSSAKQSFSFS